MTGIVILSVFFLFFSVFSRTFPRYEQCDKRWGDDEMGVPGMTEHDDTICHQGCAMSSLSMALAGFKIEIYNETATPKNLNKWLRNNDGYHCISGNCCNLVLNAVDKLADDRIRCLGEPLVPHIETLRKFINDGVIVLAHVRNQHHFVLVTGNVPDEDAFYTNDPNHDVKSYPYSDIHDIILYDII